jgi:hypothetical protein
LNKVEAFAICKGGTLEIDNNTAEIKTRISEDAPTFPKKSHQIRRLSLDIKDYERIF